MSHGGGGWHGSMGTVGGLTRTYGLHRHFGRDEEDGPRVPISRAGLRRIARYFRPYWLLWLLIVVCVATAARLAVLPPLCVREIIDRALPRGDRPLLMMMTGAMVGLAMACGLIGVLQQTLTANVGQRIMHDLRTELFRHLQRMGLGFYTANRSGEIVSRINNDVSAVEGVATHTLVSIAQNLAVLTFTAVAMFRIDWRLTLLAVAVVPAFYLPSKIVGRIRRRLSMQTQQSRASLLGFLNERLHVGGALLVNIFGQQQADAETFTATSGRVRDLNVRQTVVGRWLFMILSIFSAVGPALVFWYGGGQVMRRDLSLGDLIAFAALLTLLYRPLVQLATVYVDIQGSVAVFERIFEYLDLDPEVQDPPDALALQRVRGHVRFEDVGFCYPKARPQAAAGNGNADGNGETGGNDEAKPQEPFALQDVSFQILPGQRVALVGPSGAGKTTITYLLPRFYDPSAGRILLDDHDLRRLSQESFRRHIGMVTQETFLFHASIRENLLYARAAASDEQMIDACRAAYIHDFIAALPEGYDTVVGERGFRLSGGEKQRLSIARALLKDPAILILDEATSNLDATSECLIQAALEKLLQGRTSLIIAHRLSTILSCDCIVVLQAGRVVDLGRHEDLLQRGGLYAQLFHQQFGRVLQLNGARA